MCGIAGYIGLKKAAPILIKSLSKLEYRGYDSAGVAVLSNNKIKLLKAKGRLNVLSDMTCGGESIEGSVGIGHTRWATHGAPSDINSHPHLGGKGRIAVVHNGIIENYKELKQWLSLKGYRFVSDTDTEVIGHLIDWYYKDNILSAILNAILHLQGSYAIGVVSSDNPEELFALRKESPLIVGLGEGENFIASDIPAVLDYTKKVYFLENDEIAWLKKDGSVKVLDLKLREIEKEAFFVDWDAESAKKDGYEHFMLKEIFEQPTALRNTINSAVRDGKAFFSGLGLTHEQIKSLKKIYVIGCGSAYHAGVVGRYIFEQMAKIDTQAELAAEFRYRNNLLSKDDLVIAISQSGETADTLAAMREAKKVGAKVIGIVNVPGSSVAREADWVLYTAAGPEISVATTKVYLAQLQILYLLAIYFAEVRGFICDSEHKSIVSEIFKLPEKIEKMLCDVSFLSGLALKKHTEKNMFFIGRGLDWCTALEAALKLKEISYIHAQAYHAGELKHGTISLIEEGSIVVVIATQNELFDKTISNAYETASRGAVIFGIATEGNTKIEQVCDCVYYIPDTIDILKPIETIIPLQIFAYYMAVYKGCDVDKPRNLAKSVTVE